MAMLQYCINKTGSQGILQKKTEVNNLIKVKFLHPAGLSSSFFYPRKTDVLWISIENVH